MLPVSRRLIAVLEATRRLETAAVLGLKPRCRAPAGLLGAPPAPDRVQVPADVVLPRPGGKVLTRVRVPGCMSPESNWCVTVQDDASTCLESR